MLRSYHTYIFRLKISLSVIVLQLLLSKPGFCQCSERISITTDRDIYFPGEPVWYRLNCLSSGSDKPSQLSKVVYLELMTLNSVPVAQYKLYLNNGQHSSRFIIPDTLSTGNYIIRGYTNWMKNFGSQVFSQNLISVINPFQKNKFANIDQTLTKFRHSGENDMKSNISLVPLLKEYKHRSPVELNIQNTDGLSSISVSVVKKGLVGKNEGNEENLKSQITDNSKHNSGSNKLKVDILPEMEGEIILGTIKSKKNNTPVINQVLTLGFVGKVPSLYLSKTDSTGRFRFVVNQFGEQNMVIQPLTRDTTNNDFLIEIEPSFNDFRDIIRVERNPVDDTFIDEIGKCILTMQVEALYKVYGNKKEIPDTQPVRYFFYGEPEIKVELARYIELPTMSEVFKEIVPTVGVRDIKDKNSFIITGSTGALKSSFTMVDGILIKDINRILAIDPEEVKQIEVINSMYYLEDQELGAIISIQTRKGDLSALDFDNRIFRQEFTGYENSYSFSQPDYSIDSVFSSPMADFRNLLYWNPEIKSDKGKSSCIKFYTSDDSGNYLIIIEGINPKGETERIEFPFSVTN